VVFWAQGVVIGIVYWHWWTLESQKRVIKHPREREMTGCALAWKGRVISNKLFTEGWSYLSTGVNRKWRHWDIEFSCVLHTLWSMILSRDAHKNNTHTHTQTHTQIHLWPHICIQSSSHAGKLAILTDHLRLYIFIFYVFMYPRKSLQVL